MKNYPLWKIFVVFLLVSLGVIFAIPSFLYPEDSGSWYFDIRLNLGLDLPGGSYLLLEVPTRVLIEEGFENFTDTIRIISRENRVKINKIEKIDDELKIIFENNTNLDEIRNKFLPNYRSVKFNIKNPSKSISIDELFLASLKSLQLNNL
jgi:Preprotein translocase subunit SecD